MHALYLACMIVLSSNVLIVLSSSSLRHAMESSMSKILFLDKFNSVLVLTIQCISLMTKLGNGFAMT